MTGPQRFRKKPIPIEAMQWTPSDEASEAIRVWAVPAVAIVDTDHIQHLWDYDAGCYILPSGKTVFAPFGQRCLIVLTLEGEMIAAPGDWIIRGVQGEFYPCKPDIFDATYNPDRSPLSDKVRTVADAVLSSPRPVHSGRTSWTAQVSDRTQVIEVTVAAAFTEEEAARLRESM